MGVVEVVRIAIVTRPAHHEGLKARGFVAVFEVCRPVFGLQANFDTDRAQFSSEGFSNRFWVGEVGSANRHIPKLKVKAIWVASLN